MLKKTDPDIIKGYLEDSSNLSGGQADGAYIPESEKDIAEALKECNNKKIPLTVSAGETGTTGGCIPFGGWVLTTQKLNKIITIDKGQKSALVQPGVTLEEIEKSVKKEGLLYPPDPTEKKATIGGNVATNASGGRSYRFGSTRNWIRRLKVVLASGEVLDLKRNTPNPYPLIPIPDYKMPKVKNSAGYFAKPGMDLIDLFIGSEGTLGIVSEIEIALRPALAETFDIVAFFPSEELAVDFVLQAKSKKDPTVNFFEYLDENTLQMLKETYSHIPERAKAAVYVEQEVTPENEKTYLENWAQLLEKFTASIDNCWLGMNAAQKEELAKFRHAIPEHINELYKQNKLVKLATDIAVPTNKFKEMYGFYNSEIRNAKSETNLPAGKAGSKSEIFHIKFGHIGENHLHVNLLPKSEKEKAVAKDLIMKFVKKAISLGGTISAEHGVGKIKHDYLKEMYGQEGINEMIRVKKALDPNCILNQNNIFKIPG
ncbi:MAG: FAD-binding oxidoreductase [Candidatus Margulisbacteria bacterium]|nr:FAD-binding oxidoreductase [Candidatus Margulisiibacteriota bacterium]